MERMSSEEVMAELVVSVLTYKSVQTILQTGGTQSWALDKERARSCDYVVICRNAKTRDAEGPEEHGSAFMVGKISDVVPSTETPGRWLIKMSEYALVDWPNEWEGRNPVAYWTTDDYDVGAEGFRELDFQPVPDTPAADKSDAIQHLTFSFPPALQAWIESRVAEGRYADAGDYIRDLIRRDQGRAQEDVAWVRPVSGSVDNEPEDATEEIIGEPTCK
jgi:Arc/MetJ-type ribon-helix-helix transcriptional regulator